MRINWFSPLAPARTDIAHFTSRLLPALSARAEVVLWTDQPHWHSGLRQHAEVRHFDPDAMDWPALDRAAATFYNIGNDARFHSGIWTVAQQYPGFAIMHDVYMHDSLWFDHHEREDREGYLAAMESLYGASGRRDARFYWDGVLPLESLSRLYTCAPFFLESALGAVVHSRAAARSLAAEIDLPVTRLDLPYPARPEPAPHSGPPPWRLVVVGYLGANRCLDRILSALASLENPEQFRLHIYGQILEPAPVAEQIAALRLESLVTIHGFVSEAELNAALDAAHLAVNLRFPTKGEASGSQLRLWSHGLPSIVTRLGWYAELPEDTAAFVRPQAIAEDLRERLREYAAAPGRFAAFGRKGYEYLAARHSPERYAAGLVGMAENAAAWRRQWNARRIASRAKRALGGWIDAAPGFRERVEREAGELAGCPGDRP